MFWPDTSFLKKMEITSVECLRILMEEQLSLFQLILQIELKSNVQNQILNAQEVWFYQQLWETLMKTLDLMIMVNVTTLMNTTSQWTLNLAPSKWTRLLNVLFSMELNFKLALSLLKKVADAIFGSKLTFQVVVQTEMKTSDSHIMIFKQIAFH